MTETLEYIEEFEQKTREQLAFLKTSVAVLEPIKNTEEAHLYYLLTAKFGVMTYETYLKWCKEAKEELRRKGK